MIEPQYYSLDVSAAAWWLLGAMAACMAVAACIMWPKLLRVRKQVASDSEAPLPSEGYPSVSVIVYTICARFFLRFFSKTIHRRSR